MQQLKIPRQPGLPIVIVSFLTGPVRPSKTCSGSAASFQKPCAARSSKHCKKVGTKAPRTIHDISSQSKRILYNNLSTPKCNPTLLSHGLKPASGPRICESKYALDLLRGSRQAATYLVTILITLVLMSCSPKIYKST